MSDFLVGDLVRVRGRRWIVETAVSERGRLGIDTLDLACMDDDAQGERLRAVVGGELDLTRLSNDMWSEIAREGPDNPQVLAAHLRAIKWRSSTAADRNLFQAPFRAGIRLDPYQLLPLAKALRLPRVNLLIADDVGLGKTVEAGLVLRELLLRRRIDYIVVSAPAAMTAQWQDELAQKFGLSFTIVDRDYLASVRRAHGFSANPWTVGSRFIISHSLLGDEIYRDGLEAQLGNFRPRAMLILDEAHHAAPASGIAYATDSQFTRAIRGLAERFEHRLFLSATPHNGHSNSFSSLLEILDPQRFTRGVPVEPDDLEPVMVRRLKSDLLKLKVSKFPERRVEPILIDGLPADAPELILSEMLERYRSWCETGLQGTALGQARFLMSGLQQRLLSSIPAFARTLRRHLETLKRHRDRPLRNQPAPVAALLAFPSQPDEANDYASEADLLTALQVQEDEIADAATQSVAPAIQSLDGAIAQVESMLVVASANERRPDARIRWLVEWIRTNMMAGERNWCDRRLILFTEWEDTRIWLERQLIAEFEDTDRGRERILTFTGLTSADRREAVKLAFNTDPAREPVRIMLCTDAAREGINLQTRCHDLIHVDLPWNPSRLEQRNGRIDRKLQPSPVVTCRYFFYRQRPEDRVLQALVRKTETIREQLGSAGQVLSERVEKRLKAGGIARGTVERLTLDIEGEEGDAAARLARQEMADGTDRRLARLKRELALLDRDLESARKRVGIEPDELKGVVETALKRDGVPLAPATDAPIGHAFRLDPTLPAFTRDHSWNELFDELREGRPPKPKQLVEWRANKPIRAISFDAPVLPDGRDADGVVHVHLEHRLVRRLINRFVSHGFQAGLNRASVIYGPGSQTRVVLVGRLALYGPAAARLHEEIIVITAIKSESSLRPLGERGEQTTLEALEEGLNGASVPPREIVQKLLSSVKEDLAGLRPALEARAKDAAAIAARDLAELAQREAASLEALLTAQRDRIRALANDRNALQLEFDLADARERRQREADRRHWTTRLESIERELTQEPTRIAASLAILAERLEPLGIVYLSPRQA
ncbi:DISARM system SNF2-like helicase DrmD [Mesorhizobium sp. RP14(2022)]|uniref:DISARM system SNF2-like helicase DrmD n=1 Tax=Mesorhizobium liriopis TaxID=2953882 RepID=A0ABT1C0L7_9HYPH|nr:DISARM system SNF2-like helicase DrmD [Mesorhizobium liriopis]MCO6048378.1 DISARM system SNF2-like helicase DrmD [Mesorhizobium liriopis]